MKKALIALLFAMLAVPGFADDLLDAVLREDTPAAKPNPATRASAPVPFGRTPAKAAPRISAPPKGALEREEVLLDSQIQDARQHVESAMDAGRRYMMAKEAGVGEREENADDGDRSAAEMERRARLLLRGGRGGGAKLSRPAGVSFAGELTVPLWQSAFDLSLRGFHNSVDFTEERSYQETYYTWSGWYRHKHTRTKHYTFQNTFQFFGGEAIALWRPFRGKVFSPYTGVGGRYEALSKEYEKDDDFILSFVPAWRIGGTLNFWRLWFGGEYAGSVKCSEVVGTVGFRCGRHLALHAFGEWFSGNGQHGGKYDGRAFGGGVTWVF